MCMYIHCPPVGFVYFASELHAVYLHMGQIYLLQIFYVGMHNACLGSIYVFCLSFMCVPHIILACVHFECVLHILCLYVSIIYHFFMMHVHAWVWIFYGSQAKDFVSS